MMKKLILAWVGWLAWPVLLSAQDAAFFRITAPVPTQITGFGTNGFISWTNAPTNTTFTIQIARSLIGPSNWLDYVQVPATNAPTSEQIIDFHPPTGMALIPAGSFTMGDSLDTNNAAALPLHTVYISTFHMDKYAVTKTLWSDVYNWATNHGYSFDHAGLGKTNTHPVQTVSWYDCVKWCNARSEKEGKTPAYYTDAGLTVRYQNGQVTPYVNWSAGYRLPTEAEWEKAERGGPSGLRFSWGNTISWSQANYRANTNYSYDASPASGYHPTFATNGTPYTSPVDYFAPNGYGLYDMTGNVFEWCWDWLGDYAGIAQTDPRGSAIPVYGSFRISRGCSWKATPNYCPTAIRSFYSPSDTSNDLGFRSVLPN